MEDEEVIRRVSSPLIEIGWIQNEDIIDSLVYPMHYAYPVLEIGFEAKIEKLFNYFKRFQNLTFAGRNSRFEYIHLDNIMKSGKEIVENYRKRFMK